MGVYQLNLCLYKSLIIRKLPLVCVCAENENLVLTLHRSLNGLINKRGEEKMRRKCGIFWLLP